MKKTNAFDFAQEVYCMKIKKINWLAIIAIVVASFMLYEVLDTAYMIIKYKYTN